MDELATIKGSGKDGRVAKNDILAYVESRASTPKATTIQYAVEKEVAPVQKQVQKATPVSVNGEDEMIEMTRMGKLISKHMVNSVQTAAHVQSFIEIDVTNIVNWREKVKDAFFQREGEKLTFTPIFITGTIKFPSDSAVAIPILINHK